MLVSQKVKALIHTFFCLSRIILACDLQVGRFELMQSAKFATTICATPIAPARNKSSLPHFNAGTRFFSEQVLCHPGAPSGAMGC